MEWWKRRYDPFEEFMREFERMMKELTMEFEPVFRGMSTYDKNIREPLMDMYVDGDKLKIIVELPGVEKKDIHVKFIDNKTIEISAERKIKFEEEYKKYGGEFKYYRVIRLPYEVKPETTKATYNNGILEITVELKEVPKEKYYEVKIE